MGTYIKSISFFPDCMNIEYSLLNIPFQETILYNQPVDIKVSPFLASLLKWKVNTI